MVRLPELRGLPRGVGARRLLFSILAGLVGLVASTVGCKVDETGLGSMPKLSRDAGFDAVIATGGHASGGAIATGGSGSGGVVVASGGTGGGQPGTGGVPDATGGMTGDTGGTVGAGGATGGEGGAGGGAGEPGTGGAGGMAGAGGVAGTAGMGGRAGSGGTRCTALNCMGCCAGTVCVTTPTAQQCGTRGGACMACGPCQLCSAAGQCAIDPNSQWTIVAQSAQVTHSPPAGGSWDAARGDLGGNLPDLFCEYENPAGDITPTTAGVTSTVTDAYSASWNETITPPGVTVSASALMAAKPAWRIWVGDEDCSNAAGTNCTSGQTACSYQKPISAADLLSGSLTLSNVQSCVSLDLGFVCASPMAP
jgi:hypothetical protein